MEFHDWCQYFTHASICHNVNINDLTIRGTWHEREFQGRWEGALAGGVVDKDAILHNPQVSSALKSLEIKSDHKSLQKCTGVYRRV